MDNPTHLITREEANQIGISKYNDSNQCSMLSKFFEKHRWNNYPLFIKKYEQLWTYHENKYYGLYTKGEVEKLDKMYRGLWNSYQKSKKVLQQVKEKKNQTWGKSNNSVLQNLEQVRTNQIQLQGYKQHISNVLSLIEKNGPPVSSKQLGSDHTAIISALRTLKTKVDAVVESSEEKIQSLVCPDIE